MDDQACGLTSDEVRRRLEKFGPNAMPDTALHPLRMALEKFWAPIPWMLEAAIMLQIALGDYLEAAIIAVLLVFNAVLGLFQEAGYRGRSGSLAMAAFGPERRLLRDSNMSGVGGKAEVLGATSERR